jgi:predicted NUDIX family phosphoesterase
MMGITYKAEKVLTFPSDILVETGYFQGISYDIDKYLKAISNCYSYTDRSAAEGNPKIKQIVPYSIILYQGNLIRYKRGSHSGEPRLRGNLSIGLGGHIIMEDGTVFPDLCVAAMLRELNEELVIDSSFRHKKVALLNDDSNEVGKVHFGIINIVEVDSPRVFKKEKGILELGFTSVAQLKQDVSKYERWSMICIEEIERILSAYYERP